MPDTTAKDLFSQAELDKFCQWAAAQEAAGEKITFRAVKAYMQCGHLKADALRRQYVDNKTRGAVEVAQQAELPENVLNAFSEHMTTLIRDVVNKMSEQIKEAEARAEETAEMLEAAERTAENATREMALAKELATTVQAKLDVLEKEHTENKATIARLVEELQAAKIEAAAAKASLDTAMALKR